MKSRTLAFAAALMAASALHAYAADGDDAERLRIWTELSRSVFGDKPINATDKAISLDAPKRAEDASLVPITINVAPDAGVVGTDLIIDENPSPVAARIKFGPAGDPRQMKLRVRVNSYTNIHAVAKTANGGLLQNTRFLKASGGCSAPVGASDQEAMKTMGEMRMRFGSNAELGGAPEATLMIRHPNFNGMQMDQVKRTYTPARFITSIDVARGDRKVFSIESDISLSTNPVISFLYKQGQSDEPFHVTVKDSEGRSWEQEFDTPKATN
jgi:sulfur-oxidizing protein SoxY